MTNIAVETNNNNNTSTNDILKWETDDIFEANFMLPTDHFKDELEMKMMLESDFSDLLIGMLEPFQPLNNHERTALATSVRSGNRLRMYYQATTLVRRRLEILNETQCNSIDGAYLSEVMGDNAVNGRVSIVSEDTPDILDNEQIEDSPIT